MTCELARNAIVDAQTGNLDEGELGELQAHLGSCASCASEAQELNSWWESLAAYHSPPMSPEIARQFRGAATGAEAVATVRQPQSVRRRLMRTALYAAVAVAAWGIGRFTAPIERPDGRASGVTSTTEDQLTPVGTPFLLLILGEGSQPGSSPAETQAIVAEYRRWAEGLARQGRLVSAGKLTDGSGLVLGASATSPAATSSEERVTGFFVILARDLDEARKTAWESPHIKRGGRIELRAIETT